MPTTLSRQQYTSYSLALLPDWSEAASIACPDKLDSSASLWANYLQWLKMTRGNISVLSMSAGMQNNSSRLDLDAEKHFDAYQYTSNLLRVSFDRDIQQPTPFNAYCDLAES